MKSFIRVASSNQVGFTNTNTNDMILFTTSQTQKILMGTKQNNLASLAISSNAVVVNEDMGIGKSNPAYKLDVTGDINFTGTLRQNGNAFQTSRWSSNASGIHILSNVGVGTNTPGHRLDVAGTIRAGVTGSGTSLMLGDSTITTGNRIISALDSTLGNGGEKFIAFGKADQARDQAELVYVHQGNGSTTNRLVLGFHSAGVMSLLANGNVGIGTTSPSYQLDVMGTTRTTRTFRFAGNEEYGVTTSNRRYALIATVVGHYGLARFVLTAGSHGTASINIEVIVEARARHISGTIFRYGSSGAGLVVIHHPTHPTNTSYGIFEVYMTGADYHWYNIEIHANPNCIIPTSIAWSADTAWTVPSGFTLWFDTSTHCPANALGHRFYMTSAGNPVNAMTMLNNGNVGVGTTAPSRSLHVNALHPPVGTNITGYVASASSQWAPHHAANFAIDAPFGGFWLSQARYNISTGAYVFIPQETTVVSSVTYPGEWWQLTLPSAMVMTGFRFYGSGVRRYVIAGSQGSTWTSLLIRNTTTNLPLTNNTWHTITFANTTAYTHYRFIILEAVVGQTYPAEPQGAFALHDARFFSSAVLCDGSVAVTGSLSVGSDTADTQNPLRVGNNMVVDWNGNILVGASSSDTNATKLVVEKNDGTSASTGAYIVIKNQNSANSVNGVVRPAGGILFSSHRDVRDPCYTAGITYETIGTTNNLFTHANLIFRTTNGAAANFADGDSALPPERARITSAGHFRPGADNAYSLGETGFKWSVIHAATGTINQSDERAKLEFEPTFGLEFIKALEPVSYRYKHGKTVFEQVEDGVEEVPAVFDEQGNEVTPATTRPKYKSVEKIVQGTRRHHGLKAQQVKEVLDAQTLGDFAGWVMDDLSDPESQQGLRYDQFIAPLIRAVQELSTKNTNLEARLAALESRE